MAFSLVACCHKKIKIMKNNFHIMAKVTPHEVKGIVDYNKLIRDFGCLEISHSQIDRLEKLTGRPAHRFLRRGIFFAHRDLDKIMDAYERKEPFYLYTGRGPSSESMHLGHMVPFIFTKYLQEVFDVNVVIQMTDDEKFLFRDLTLEQVREMTAKNIQEIIAFGFNPNKTFIFSNLAYVGTMYQNICRIQRCLSFNQVKGAFGFDDTNNIGKIGFPAIQAAPSFSSSFPHLFGESSDILCLVPQAIDQDPYFRLTRDVARKLNLKVPAQIHSVFFPALGGPDSKMSSSDPSSGIFLSDTPQQIKKKINSKAYSGGGATLLEHQKHGANLEVDVAFQLLKFFLEDDARLNEIAIEYSAGRRMSGEIKHLAIEVVQTLVHNHQLAVEQLTDDFIKLFTLVS